ncbi:hypothetical protein TMatcc_009303 [Talaromyces marneffei ATCC 18224]
MYNRGSGSARFRLMGPVCRIPRGLGRRRVISGGVERDLAGMMEVKTPSTDESGILAWLR